MARTKHNEELPAIEAAMLGATGPSPGLYKQQVSDEFQTAVHEAGIHHAVNVESRAADKAKSALKDVVPWSAEDDLALLRRIVRLLEPVPNVPRRRIKAYLFELLSEEIPF